MAEELKEVREKKGRGSYLNKLTRISPGWNLVLLIFLLILAVIVIVPVALVVVVSLSTAESIALNGYSFLPSEWTLIAYENLLGKGLGTQILQSYIVTIAMTAVGTVLSLFLMSLYAYVLAQRNFPAKRFYTLILFFTMLFSGGLVPSYIVNRQYLHLYDNFWVLVLPGLIAAYNVFILRTFMQSTIPEAMFDAARIDGASDFRIYWQIVLPLCKAGLAVVAMWAIVGRWNDWFTGMLYIENAKLVPLQTMLQKIQNNIDFIKNNSQMKNSVEGASILKSLPGESTRMAIVVISTVPIIFAYPLFQRYFIQGITVGSVKG